MRFSYNPVEGRVAIYVKKEEFDLAANENEYRVFSRVFDPKNLEQFIEGYTNFIQQICNFLVPDEQIKDIVTFSTYKNGYTWRSLLNLDYSDESASFLENLLAYGLSTIDQEEQNRIPNKPITEFISRRDANKLSLIMTLLNQLPSLPQPYKKRKRPPSSRSVQKHIDSLNLKLKMFEEKYGFNSETMLKYYENDKIMDDNMGQWISVYSELKFINSVKNREMVAEEVMEIWSKKV